MVGIVSAGAYIPIYRLNRDEIARMWGGRSAGGAKAVAGYDEDTITMAVAATLDCLKRGGARGERLIPGDDHGPIQGKAIGGYRSQRR